MNLTTEQIEEQARIARFAAELLFLQAESPGRFVVVFADEATRPAGVATRAPDLVLAIEPQESREFENLLGHNFDFDRVVALAEEQVAEALDVMARVFRPTTPMPHWPEPKQPRVQIRPWQPQARARSWPVSPRQRDRWRAERRGER